MRLTFSQVVILTGLILAVSSAFVAWLAIVVVAVLRWRGVAI